MTRFPGEVLEVHQLLVTDDLAASRTFYVEVLGAGVVRESPDMLVFVDRAGASQVLPTGGGPTDDKPTVTFATPGDPDRVDAELIIRVRDVHTVYRALTERGAEFLTAPMRTPWGTRCYVRGPDGHLIELTEPPSPSSPQLQGVPA